jgi:hypothetical protein
MREKSQGWLLVASIRQKLSDIGRGNGSNNPNKEPPEMVVVISRTEKEIDMHASPAVLGESRNE